MTNKNVIMWKPQASAIVPDSTSNVPDIVKFAVQLRDRERKQVADNFSAGNYELASTFVWHRAITLLKKQLATLGNVFIAELLQRPDIDERADITTSISATEAISLAKDLGIITSTQTMRLLHAQEIVNHFASIDGDDALDTDEVMTQEEAVSCLRVCVQGILGHEKISVAENFAEFRKNLEAKTFTSNSPEIVRLQQSPYFFIRTAISILLSILRTANGAPLEHAARNAALIIPRFWADLKKPERWQVGQAYASEFNEGRKESVHALYSLLLEVKGFDYVPENLRSNTFIRAASAVIRAHEGMNNFYNEPAPMRELANLGSSIPPPALPACITAALCVKLGNMYGKSWGAQSAAEQVISSISDEQWLYYFEERLAQDLVILPKLRQSKPRKEWIEAVSSLDLDQAKIKAVDSRNLLVATKAANDLRVNDIAGKMLKALV